ncbi:MAG: Cof-type HAD-IIB family hydrolase [Fusobacteriaceae bacterium]
MIKLIVTDMDGTFLNDNHEIDARFWGIFEEMKSKGIMFAVASGRQYFNLVENFECIKEEILFVAENGTIVMFKDKELFSSCIGKQDVKHALQKLKAIKNIGIVLCGKNTAYIEDTSPEFLQEVQKYYHRREVVGDLNQIKDEIIKIAIYDFEDAQTNSYPHIEMDSDRYKVVVSGKHWVDIMHLNSNKGEAIKKIREIFKFEKNEIAAFGDYLNDYDMMMEVEHSFAMENAHSEIKKISKYIAKSNNESGVVECIIKILENSEN